MLQRAVAARHSAPLAPSVTITRRTPRAAAVPRRREPRPGCDRHAAESFRLGLVGDHVIGIGHCARSSGWPGAGFRIVRMPCSRPKPQRVVHRLQGDLQLQHDAIGRAQQVRGGVHVGRQQRGRWRPSPPGCGSGRSCPRRSAPPPLDTPGVISTWLASMPRALKVLEWWPARTGRRPRAPPSIRGRRTAARPPPGWRPCRRIPDGTRARKWSRPGRGNSSVKVVRSILALPTTTICGSSAHRCTKLSSFMETDPTRRFSHAQMSISATGPRTRREHRGAARKECGLDARAPRRRYRLRNGTAGGTVSAIRLRGFRRRARMPRCALAGERLLAGYPRFHSVDGRAEATSLPDASRGLRHRRARHSTGSTCRLRAWSSAAS